jgi:hypothetical protein
VRFPASLSPPTSSPLSPRARTSSGLSRRCRRQTRGLQRLHVYTRRRTQPVFSSSLLPARRREQMGDF